MCLKSYKTGTQDKVITLLFFAISLDNMLSLNHSQNVTTIGSYKILSGLNLNSTLQTSIVI